MAYAAIAGVVLTAISTGVAVYSSYETGRREKKVADANARLAEIQAEQAEKAAKVRAAQYSREAKRRMSAMRARFAVSGVATTEGTPLLILMESAQEVAKDKLRIERGGQQTAWGLLQEAKIQRLGGKSAYQRGILGAGATLLSGAARTYKAYGAL